MKVLVLGGYGHFGGRICRALARHTSIELLVAGRSAERAQKFARELGPSARGVALDCSKPSALTESLARESVGLVIHTAGPFQAQDYAVAIAVARAGSHYIDLADGRRFVCDFRAAADASFVAAGKVAITGASSVPALSSAVVDHLSRDWSAVHTIDVCIAPAQKVPRGVATMAAVLSYCGEPVRVFQDGQWRTMYGWLHSKPVQFRRLAPRMGALCDVPDLELFPARFPGLRTAMFRAALEVPLSQYAMGVLATLRRAGLLPNVARLARPLNTLSVLFDPLGSPSGGMVVAVTGVARNGAPCRAEWHLAAHQFHGPEIPCMAAIVLARRFADEGAGGNGGVEAGARPCLGLVSLAEFEQEFARWDMPTDIVL